MGAMFALTGSFDSVLGKKNESWVGCLGLSQNTYRTFTGSFSVEDRLSGELPFDRKIGRDVEVPLAHVAHLRPLQPEPGQSVREQNKDEE